MYGKTKKEVNNLRKLDQFLREWEPPKDYRLWVTRDEFQGVVSARMGYRDGTLRELDFLCSDTIAAARRKFDGEFAAFKSELEGEA